ncbi:MAG: PAS domain S-box protein [Methylobacter sp.]|uniref:PAS domain-containing sensor histidine kinase n=1 Tax=Methylobacter sp. TaxID=2051955 RepID=UPI00273030EC|nr:PAS domain S-box protein [Methylobacter sp.]MDP1666212.1 PAS domain S-box protein [Methylobacter sp.]
MAQFSPFSYTRQMQPLIDFFGINDLIPHGYCLSWSPVLLWLHVISDLLITLAYYSIPLILVYFIRQRKDFPYPLLATMFAGFIIACGTTHLLSAVTIWIPLYWLDGLVKALTAIVSVTTAVLMLWVIPGALSLPSVAQLQAEMQKRKTIEDALRESEYRWKFAIEGSGDGVWDWDIQTNETLYSSRWKEMLGYGKNDILPNIEDWINLVYPDDQPHVTEAGQAYLNGKTALYLVEYRLRCKDGSYKWILSRGMVVSCSEDGKPLRMIGTHKDISARKQAEQVLQQSRKELQEAQRIAHMGSWQLDLKTHHVAWSEQLYRMLGLNPELPPPDYTEHFRLFTPESWKLLSAALPHTQETGIPYELELEMIKADGAHGWMLARGEVMRDDTGAIVGLHGVALDITERKQAEQVFTQLKAMIDISMDGFWIVDLMGNVLQVNEAYAKISGYSIDELMNMHISQLEAIEGPEQVKAHIAKVVAQGYDLFETCHRHKHGHIIDIEVSIAFLPEFQQFCVFCRDITERKLMENQLKASEAKLRSIIEASPVPMALHDEQSNITFLNPAFMQTFGYSIDDIPTMSDWRAKAYPDPDYRHWAETTWQTSLEKANQEQNGFPPLELTIRCKNNSIKTVLASAAAIHHDFAGECLMILYDITRRKQIEAKLNAIFDASVEGIITYDKTNIIVSVNSAIETIFGYKTEELIGCSICKLMPIGCSVCERMPSCLSLSQTVKLFDNQIQEIEGIRKNGSVVPLDLSVAEYSIDNACYFTSIVRDVSLRKHREQQDKAHLNELAHVTRLGLMGEMASGIAHEVNQPLAAISSYTQVSLNLINTESPDLVKLTEILYKTQQQALRAGRIIHRMREFVKSHTKHPSAVDINVLIHNAVDLCMADLKQNSIKLTIALENNLPPIYVDQIQIEQVIMNLIRNSVEALQGLSPERQRQLTIYSHLVPNNVRVKVKDNGPGLDTGQQQKILTPFYTTKANGMGMGLSISRSIIEAHEGTLHFNSRHGKGTTFYFTLPMQRKPDKSL